MKFVKRTLGIEDLEERISSLENKVEEYESAITSISMILRSQSISLIGISENLKTILDSFYKKSLAKKEQEETYN